MTVVAAAEPTAAAAVTATAEVGVAAAVLAAPALSLALTLPGVVAGVVTVSRLCLPPAAALALRGASVSMGAVGPLLAAQVLRAAAMMAETVEARRRSDRHKRFGRQGRVR